MEFEEESRFDDMECEGYVSIWLGNFSNEDALLEYAAEDRVEDEDDGEEVEYPSRFSEDFFEGEVWAFDSDFWERACVEPSDDLAALVKPFSYGETFDVSGIKLDKKYNSVILIYNFKYEPAKAPAKAPVKFIATVTYEGDD